MPNVSCELVFVGEVPVLPGGPRIGDFTRRKSEFVVRESSEEISEMYDR